MHRLKDLLVRTRTNDLVTDLVNLDRVRSLLRTIAARRRFIAQRDAHLHESSTVPEIIVDDTPTTPTQDITSTNRASANMSPYRDAHDLSSRPNSYANDRWDSEVSLASRESPRPRLQRGRRTSDISVMSADLGVRHTYVDLSSPCRSTDAHHMLGATYHLCGTRCMWTILRTCSPQCKIHRGVVSHISCAYVVPY